MFDIFTAHQVEKKAWIWKVKLHDILNLWVRAMSHKKLKSPAEQNFTEVILIRTISFPKTWSLSFFIYLLSIRFLSLLILC